MRAPSWLVVVCLLVSSAADAAERLCDTRHEDCRAPLLTLIAAERQGIDVAFWFMEDQRYVDALIQRHKAGVPVRVIVDPRANDTKRLNAQMLDELKTAGIPMRMKAARSKSDILHWKMMLFAGQDVVEFSAANYTPYSFVPVTPYANYIDEAVLFSDDPSFTNTFRTRFDTLWADTSGKIRDYANITATPQRRYGVFPQDPALNFPPTQDFAVRAVGRYTAETSGIDVIMFRLPDSRHTDAMLAAKARGVRVRIIMEQADYRDTRFLWHAYNVDRLYAAGVPVKSRRHAGLTHQKSVVLRGLGEVIFGSSNWSREAADEEEEHNVFSTQHCQSGKWCDTGGWVFQWFARQFDSKWSSTTEFQPFAPLPPTVPVYTSPADGASGVSTAPALTWEGGSWAHRYDVYLGTDPNNLSMVAREAKIGSPEPGQSEVFRPSTLAPSTTYYWRIVSRTMAHLSAVGPTRRFTTGSSASPSLAAPTGLTATAGSTQIVLHWADVSSETQYRVERSTGGTATYAQVGVVSANVTSYRDSSGLSAGHTYYYRVRAATTTLVSGYSNVASANFGAQPPPEILLKASSVPETQIVGAWQKVSDATAAGGVRLSNADRGAPKILAALATPASYFEVTFNAVASTPYHLWLRMKAQNNVYQNDSVYVQLGGTVTASGTPAYRIGTTTAMVVSLENTSGAGVQGWGWNDNGWASFGTPLLFERTGTQRLRVQVREDGVSIDQIVLSPSRYLSSSPGALRNDTTILH